MPKVKAGNLTLHYDQQGTGEHQARLHSVALRFRPQLSAPVSRKFHAAIRRRPEARRGSPDEQNPGPNSDQLGKQDVATSPSRFADPLRKAIRQSELVTFEGCSHAPLYENVAEFNEKTLQFLNQHQVQRLTND